MGQISLEARRLARLAKGRVWTALKMLIPSLILGHRG